MKTFADVKRKMTLGTKWRTIRLFNNEDIGVREISRVQTNAVVFSNTNGKQSWLWWPKAKEVQINDENSFTILVDGKPLNKYILI